jgi:mannitol-1-phosphate 5-dehydrogenase
MSKLFVQIGAGKIGRSMMGDVFTSAGYRVLFIDIDEPLVADLAIHGRYPICYSDNALASHNKWIENVGAISAKDEAAVVDAIRSADMIGVSVGKAAWPTVVPTLAKGLVARNGDPVDVVIVENVRNGGQFVHKLLAPQLPDTFPWETLGLVTTCIGRMVPSQDPHPENRGWVLSESATQFCGDRNAFVTTLPDCSGFDLVDDVAAYVDRKLFLHNMTHSAIAYVAAHQSHDVTTVADAISITAVRGAVATAANEVIPALLSRYPGAFSHDDLRSYVSGILDRYGNAALGDSLTRVGRDLPRKLGPEERIVGPLRLLAESKLPYKSMLGVFSSALWFPDPVRTPQLAVGVGNRRHRGCRPSVFITPTAQQETAS